MTGPEQAPVPEGKHQAVAARSGNGGAMVTVSVMAMLPHHAMLQLMDGLSGVQVSHVERPNTTSTVINLAPGDIVMQVNGTGVSGLSASPTMNLLCMPLPSPSVRG